MKAIYVTLFCFASCLSPMHKGDNDYIKKDQVPELLLGNIPDSLRFLMPVFDSILESDQQYRIKGKNSVLFNNINKQNENDSINFNRVRNISERYGLNNIKKYGFKGELAILMVIIHGSLQTQQLYFDTLYNEYSNGNVWPEHIAMLSDKISFNTHTTQKFGTQVIIVNNKHYMYPFDNIDSVNKRRKELGLKESVETYLQTNFGIKYSKEIYDSSVKITSTIFNLNNK